jgi:hypothetical protein
LLAFTAPDFEFAALDKLQPRSAAFGGIIDH